MVRHQQIFTIYIQFWIESKISSNLNGKLNAENSEIFLRRDFTLKIETLFEIADT